MARDDGSAAAGHRRPMWFVLLICVGLSVILSELICLLVYRLVGLAVDLSTSAGLVMVLAPAILPATISPAVFWPLVRSRRQMQRLLQELRRTTAELDAEVHQRRLAQARLEYNAAHDELTGLRNRRGFFEAVAPSVTGLCIVIDIDSFKLINDEFGHAAGDLALTAITEVTIAAVDEGAVVGRLGGDELVVFDRHPDETVVRRLTRALREVRVDWPERELLVSASVGAVLIDEPIGIDEALARADLEMYREKARRAAASPPEADAPLAHG